jgi:hypothetical protein
LVGVGESEIGPEGAGVRQADAGRQPDGHGHAVGRDGQRPAGRDVAVFVDGGAEALGDLGSRFPVGVVDAFNVRAAKLVIVALPGLGAPDLVESRVALDLAGRVQGLPGFGFGAGHQVGIHREGVCQRPRRSMSVIAGQPLVRRCLRAEGGRGVTDRDEHPVMLPGDRRRRAIGFPRWVSPLMDE